MINFLIPAASAYTVTDYLAREKAELVERFRLIRYEELAGLDRLERGPTVLMGLEQLGPAMLALVSSLVAQLQAQRLPCLNDPRRTLNRFNLLSELHRLGRNDFRIVRAGADLGGLRYPVFVREENSHTGSMTPLLKSPREVQAAIGRALVLGCRFNDLVITEFCDTRDAAGLYRKYAAYKIGDRILARSLNAGREWMLKLESSEFTRELVLEDQQYVFDNPHVAELTELFALAKVDYGQIDYAFQDGKLQTWEINLNPTIGRSAPPGGGPGPKELHPIRNETREYFFARFQEAWEALDRPALDRGPIALDWDPQLVAAATVPRNAPGFRQRVTASLVHRFRPVVRPVAGPLFRMLGALRRMV